MLFQLSLRCYHECLQEPMRLMAEPGREWQALETAVEQYMGFAQECPQLWSLVFDRHAPGFTPSAESMAGSQRLLGESVEATTLAIERGAFAPRIPPAHANDLFIAMLHGLTWLAAARITADEVRDQGLVRIMGDEADGKATLAKIWVAY